MVLNVVCYFFETRCINSSVRSRLTNSFYHLSGQNHGLSPTSRLGNPSAGAKR